MHLSEVTGSDMSLQPEHQCRLHSVIPCGEKDRKEVDKQKSEFVQEDLCG